MNADQTNRQTHERNTRSHHWQWFGCRGGPGVADGQDGLNLLDQRPLRCFSSVDTPGFEAEPSHRTAGM